MRRASFPSTILFLGLVSAALAQERGRLLEVRSGGDARSSSVELVGDRPLSFTTLQLQSPPRVIVDFADTDVAGAPAELSVEDGTVRRVATAAAGARTARVVIELAADAEFDVRAKGNRVEVRVPRIAPLVAQAARRTQVNGVHIAQAEPAPPSGPQASAQQAPASLPQTAPSEEEKRASLPTVSLVGARPAGEVAAAEPPRPSPAEEKRRLARETLAAQKRAAEAAAEKKRRERAERLVAYATAQRAAAERAKAAKRAAAEHRAAVAAEKRAAAEQAAAEKKVRARAVAEKAAADKQAKALAAAEKVAAQKKARQVAAADATGRRAAAADRTSDSAGASTDEKNASERAAAEKAAAARYESELAAAAKGAAEERARRAEGAGDRVHEGSAVERAAAEQRAREAAIEASSQASATNVPGGAAQPKPEDSASAQTAAAQDSARAAPDGKARRPAETEPHAAAQEPAAEKPHAAEMRAKEIAAADVSTRPAAPAERVIAQSRGREAASPEEPRTLTVAEAKALRAAAEANVSPAHAAPPIADEPPAPIPPRRLARAESSRIAITGIGFRPVGSGEVIIRSDRTLTYGVSGDDRSVLLHLPGTAIPLPNNRRPLDTHFFDGPVLRVVPIAVEGGTDLRIELRGRAEYQLAQSGSVLTVTFSAAR